LSTRIPQISMQELYDEAVRAAANSYSPYSRFRVGAALWLKEGILVTGTNVENMSYGLTLCAERSALVQAISRFGPAIRIEAVAIANLNQAASPPCGACRQMLSEFVLPATRVIFPLENGSKETLFSELLPFQFHLEG